MVTVAVDILLVTVAVALEYADRDPANKLDPCEWYLK
jgi:hypothetical protein